MLSLRVYSPADLSGEVRQILELEPLVSAMAVVPGASVVPPGDLITADIPREAANDLVHRIVQTGVAAEGTIHVCPAQTWVSRPGLDAEREAPGDPADAVVWVNVVQAAYRDSAFSWAFLSFMILATLMASIAIVLDSSILIIGAMVLGPEFGAIAALGVSLVTKRLGLLRRAAVALVVGFTIGIGAVTLVVLAGRALGWVDSAAVAAPRAGTAFIFSPDKWSLLIAVIAGAAGVLAMTAERSGGLVGVFISVTTIPAAGNIALGIAFAQGDQVKGSAMQLGINLVGMALAGWLTLAVQRTFWSLVPAIRPLHRVASNSDPRRGVVE